MNSFFAGIRDNLNCEQIRTLAHLNARDLTGTSDSTLSRLVEMRLATIGPPPMYRLAISYRGRHALRIADAERVSRDQLAASLKLNRHARTAFHS